MTKDAASGDAYLCVKHNEMAYGDRAYFEANGAVEFVAITSGPTTDHASCNATVTDYYYTTTRNLYGTGANDWYAGDALFNTGAVGEGFIDLYSVAGVASSGANLIVNSGAETDTSGWTQQDATFSRSTTYAYAGSWSFTLDVTDAPTGSAIVFSTCMAVAAGQQYYVQTYARAGAATGDGFYFRVVTRTSDTCSPGTRSWADRHRSTLDEGTGTRTLDAWRGNGRVRYRRQVYSCRRL